MTAAAESFPKPPSKLLQAVPTPEAPPVSRAEPFGKEQVQEHAERPSAHAIKEQALQKHIAELTIEDQQERENEIERLRRLILGEEDIEAGLQNLGPAQESPLPKPQTARSRARRAVQAASSRSAAPPPPPAE